MGKMEGEEKGEKGWGKSGGRAWITVVVGRHCQRSHLVADPRREGDARGFAREGWLRRNRVLTRLRGHVGAVKGASWRGGRPWW